MKFYLLFAVIAYIAVILIVGAYTASKHKAKDTKDMLIAGKSLGPWVLGGTMAATWVGGGTITGGSLAVGANYGWWPGILYMTCQSLAPLFLYQIAKRINRRESITVSNVFGDRYGTAQQNFAAIVIVIAYIGTCSYQFRAFGNALYVATGINKDFAIIIGTLIICGIAFMGGMRSVAVTDMISSLFITASMFIALFAAIHQGGGLEGILSRTAEGTKDFPFGNYGFVGWFSLTLGGTMNIIGDQNFIQRMASGKDDKALKKSIYVFVTIIFLVMFCSTSLGFVLRVVFPDVSSDGLFFAFAAIAPAFIGMAMLACGTALIMTTADSYLLSAVTSGVMDIWCKLVKKDATERQKVRYIRICLVIFAVIAYIMQKFFDNILSIQNYVYALYSSAITIPLFAALLSKKVTVQGATASMIVGAVLTLANEFSGHKLLWGQPSAVFSVPLSLIVIIVVSKLTYKGPTERDVKFFAEQGEDILAGKAENK